MAIQIRSQCFFPFVILRFDYSLMYLFIFLSHNFFFSILLKLRVCTVMHALTQNIRHTWHLFRSANGTDIEHELAKIYVEEMFVWSVNAKSCVSVDSERSVHRCSCKHWMKSKSVEIIINQNKISGHFNKISITCSNKVRCESPLSASGSGNFSDGTETCSCGNSSKRHSSSTISTKWSSRGGCMRRNVS